MKTLVVLAVLATVTHSQISRDGSMKQQEPQCQTNITEQAVSACVPSIQKPEIQPQALTIDRKTGFWEKAAGPQTWSNWGVIAVAIWAGCIARRSLLVLRRQTLATSRAAIATQKSSEATLKSVKLQEAQLRQWVDIDEWECIFPRTAQNRSDVVRISFWISNPTKVLMTLKTVNISAGTYGTFAMSHPNLLPPDKKHQQDISITISEPEMDTLRKGNFVLTIKVDVGFDDAFGGSPKQHFRVFASLRNHEM